MTTSPPPVRVPPRAAVETRGVDIVPESERTSRPSEFGWIWHSAQFSFGTVVLGALPVLFGLSWWASVTAILAGTAVGTALIVPLVRFGLRTGTNNPTAGGAHFGVRGRVVGSLITVGVALGFFAITVWTGGTAIMVAAAKLLGTPTGPGALAVTMPVVAVAVIAVAVFGQRALLVTYRVTAIVGGVVLLALVAVLAPRFDAGFAGGELALSGHASTWLLAAGVAVSVPMSYATFQGDYSRYMRGPDGPVMWWNGGAMFLSCVVALLVGAYTTTTLTDPGLPWLQGVTEVTPPWFAVVVIGFGLVGSFPQGGLCVYAAGLSAQSVFRRASRAAVTVVVAGIGVALLYLGAVVYDAVDSMAAFVTLLLSFVAPWTAIMTVGYARFRGRYTPEDLHADDGRYRYTRGLNANALIAFGAGVLVGLLGANTPLYVGPLSRAAAGVDVGFLASYAVAAVVFAVMDRRTS
ncbi:purine-cytosine permease family protein [Phytomonospora endophytica]|uniref:Purine-cytosine permease-like protein n=1 Tax=Phytomonospora endophytica TaxID=714109 RepID=A0A841FQ82_9ACTN|nr:cytosine permease [Phytomonospora endophytica]MBB6038246.1 purine-cytosine permease-like protein [Phytomonospora endophytica]GIG67294.1 transporter [Phytomonospora endophytica]